MTNLKSPRKNTADKASPDRNKRPSPTAAPKRKSAPAPARTRITRMEVASLGSVPAEPGTQFEDLDIFWNTAQRTASHNDGLEAGQHSKEEKRAIGGEDENKLIVILLLLQEP